MADTQEQAPKDLIGMLDFYLVKKAPFQLPEGVKEFLVKFGPWITLVLMVIALPFLLAALGLGMFAMTVVPYGALHMPAMIIGLVALVMEAIALPGLFARKMSGWRMLFYSQLVSLVSTLLQGGILGFIIGGVISLYLLFQIRSKYTD